jgi:putative radical SAM enzyme (TIGR03279 family)
MRKSLYAKDDDYLLSFVYGNYITLTNLQEGDLTRILDQHISPLYVSLHSSNKDLRQELMRSAHPVDVMATLAELSDSGIEFHIQIVCVPGFNDGLELKRTISDLMDKELNILSIGVVPVGLTKYRDGLCQLNSFDQARAAQVLDILDELRTSYKCQIIYPADELFVLAKRPVPEVEYYQDFPQLENGIGMLSLSYANFKKRKRAILKELRQSGGDFVILCSTSAKSLIAQIVKELNLRLKGQKVTLQVIRNDFFGEQVTVAGLITFSDIVMQFSPKKPVTVILPDVIFNHEGFTLDGKSREDVRGALDTPIILMDQLWEAWVCLDKDFT